MGSDQNQLFLSRQLSQLLPDVFSHPIWIQFTRNIPNYSLDLIQNLVYDLQPEQTQGDLVSNCQVMFLCTFLHSRLGDLAGAQVCIEQVLNLAETHGLEHISRCAAWGACAMCVRQDKYHEAVNWLSWLERKLKDKDEWVLVTLLEIFKQSLESQAPDSNGELLDWLLHWGEWPLNAASDRQSMGGHHSRPASLPSAGMLTSLAHQWGSLWHKIRHIVSNKWLVQMPSGVPDLLAPLLQSHTTRSSYLSSSPPKQSDLPSLAVYCLGQFRVYQDDQLITTWPSGKGKAIFKYMIANFGRSIPGDVLMDIFWREADPESARRNLHQAIYSLRQTLRKSHPNYAHVKFENNCYFLNPEMDVWCDFQEFEHKVNAGRLLESQGHYDEASVEYGIAESIYQGDFLEEDLYDEWPRSKREYLRVIYQEITERLIKYHLSRSDYTAASILCRKVLNRDNCQEQVHRLLIQCYLAQGQRHLALRQYQICVETLRKELDIEPAATTIALYKEIRRSGSNNTRF